MEQYWFNVGMNLKIVCRVIYEVRCPAMAPAVILGLNRPLTSQSLALMIERLICKLRFLPLRPKASPWYEQTNFIIDSSNVWRRSRQAGSVTQIFKLYAAAVQLCRRLNIKRLFVCIAASDNKPLARSLLRSLHHSPSLCGRVPRSSALVWQRNAIEPCGGDLHRRSLFSIRKLLRPVRRSSRRIEKVRTAKSRTHHRNNCLDRLQYRLVHTTTRQKVCSCGYLDFGSAVFAQNEEFKLSFDISSSRSVNAKNNPKTHKCMFYDIRCAQ